MQRRNKGQNFLLSQDMLTDEYSLCKKDNLSLNLYLHVHSIICLRQIICRGNMTV